VRDVSLSRRELINILVLGRKVPFTSGGQDILVKTLVGELKARNYNVDTVTLPFAATSKEYLVEQVLAWRLLNLNSFAGEKVDRVIATNFPSYFATHPKKSLWLVHQHREMYDLFASRYSDFSDDPRDEALRRWMYSSDIQAIQEAEVVTTISHTVTERLKEYNHIDALTLYPPLPLGSKYRCEEYQKYILSVGRVCSIKRIDLMVKALSKVREGISLKIVGLPDEPGIMEYLQNEIKKHNIEERVEFLGRVSDESLLDLYANCLMVYYAPHLEDYGYVTLEAFASSKAVITAVDSGGVLEFVRHNENGIIVNPDIHAIAEGINTVLEYEETVIKMGQKGYYDVAKAHLQNNSWDRIINVLLNQ
jgi:glycosyltransferase involved in cell wall biosynthesis